MGMDQDQEPIEAEIVSEEAQPDQEVVDALFDQTAGNTRPYLKRVITFGLFFGLSIAAFVAMIVLRLTVLQQGWVVGMAVIFGILSFVTGISFYLFLRVYRMIKKASDAVKQAANMSDQDIMDAFKEFVGEDPSSSNSIGTAPIDVDATEEDK